MSRRTALLPAALGLLFGACSEHAEMMPVGSSSPLKAATELQEAFSHVAERVFPSTVCITAYVRALDADGSEDREHVWREVAKAEQRYAGMRRLGSGTGFAIDRDGHFLCCLHVLRNPDGGLADVIDVETPDGRNSLCRIVGTEPTLNLAVLKLEVYSQRRPPEVEPAVIADSDAVRVGHWAIAVGDPLGPQRTYAAGVVAARPDRDCYQADLFATMLQASVQVHPEAYGGPLVNIQGEVMGIMMPLNAAQSGSAPHGHVFALPMSIASGIFEALKVANSFESPWLGFSVLNMAVYRARMKDQGVAADPRQPLMGVYIDDVFDPSPASRADIRTGDILTKIDGQRLVSVFHFQKTLYLAGIGRTVTLELYRDGETLTKELTIEGRPPAADAG